MLSRCPKTELTTRAMWRHCVRTTTGKRITGRARTPYAPNCLRCWLKFIALGAAKNGCAGAQKRGMIHCWEKWWNSPKILAKFYPSRYHSQ